MSSVENQTGDPSARSWPVRTSSGVVAADVGTMSTCHGPIPTVDLAHHRLVWAPGGILDATVGDRCILTRPPTGLWVPATAPLLVGTRHDVIAARFLASTCPASWSRVADLALDEITLTVLARTGGPLPPGRRHHLVSAAIDDIAATFERSAVSLPLPRDAQARLVAEALIEDPASPWQLADWAVEFGTSERSLRRSFREGTGLSFVQWRMRLRMNVAMGLLDQGRSVDETARACGYQSTRSFARVFRVETGSSPSEFSVRDRGSWTNPDVAWPVPPDRWPIGIGGLDQPDLAQRLLREIQEGDPMMRLGKRGAAVATAAAMLIAAACGSDDADDAGSSETAPATEASSESASASADETEPVPTSEGTSDAAVADDSSETEDAASTRIVTDFAGNDVEVPAAPQRVVGIGWQRTGVMLASLGFQPVGITGSAEDTWRAQMAQTLSESEVDLDAIDYLGAWPPNYEAIAAAEPDLIFTLVGDDEMNDQLTEIAPTVVLETDAWPEALDGERLMADLVGKSDVFEQRLTAYQDRVDAVREALGDGVGDLTYTYMDHYLGDENYIYSVAGLGDWFPGPVVLRDLGIEPEPAMLDAVGEEYFLELSLERLPDVDADLFFVGTENGDTGFGEQTSTILATTAASDADQVFEVDQVAWGYTSLSRLSSVLDDIERLLVDRELVDVVE